MAVEWIRHEGKGQLETDKDGLLDYELTFVQYGDASIRIDIVSDYTSFFGNRNQFEFSVVTTDGSSLDVAGLFSVKNNRLIFDGFKGIRETHATLTPIGEHHIWFHQSQKPIQQVRFAVTNFKFVGQLGETFTTDDSKISRLNHLIIQLDDLVITIRQVDDYKERLKGMKATKEANVTCEFIVELGDRSFKEIEEKVDALCSLLTIAKGRIVNWISYQTFDETGHPIKSFYQNRITSSFTGFQTIDKMPPELLTNYIHSGWDAYQVKGDIFNFHRIANIYSDIRSSGFVETRCLALFSLIEYFANRTSILPKCAKLNSPFKACITALIQEYDIPITSEEIDDYKEIRNKLVHEMEFRSDDYLKDYLFLLHFVDRILLRILGYEGYYLNWEDTEPKWTGAKKHYLEAKSGISD